MSKSAGAISGLSTICFENRPACSFSQLGGGVVLHVRHHSGSCVLEAWLHGADRRVGCCTAGSHRVRELGFSSTLFEEVPGAHPVFMVTAIRSAFAFPDGLSDASDVIIRWVGWLEGFMGLPSVSKTPSLLADLHVSDENKGPQGSLVSPPEHPHPHLEGVS